MGGGESKTTTPPEVQRETTQGFTTAVTSAATTVGSSLSTAVNDTSSTEISTGSMQPVVSLTSTAEDRFSSPSAVTRTSWVEATSLIMSTTQVTSSTTSQSENVLMIGIYALLAILIIIGAVIIYLLIRLRSLRSRALKDNSRSDKECKRPSTDSTYEVTYPPRPNIRNTSYDFPDDTTKHNCEDTIPKQNGISKETMMSQMISTDGYINTGQHVDDIDPDNHYSTIRIDEDLTGRFDNNADHVTQ